MNQGVSLTTGLSDLFEALVAAVRRDFFVCDITDARQRWASQQPGQHAVDGVAIALKQCLDPAVRQIAHPATELENMGLAYRRRPEPDAMNFAADEDGQGFNLVAFTQ